MTKVCHITSVHGPEDVRIFHKECVSLAQAGYETCLVQRGESYEKNGVRIVGFGEVTGGRLKRMTQVARRAYETALSVDADIYHFHDPELLPYGLKLKKKGKKVIFDSHERYLCQIREKYYLPAWCRNLAARCYDSYERYVLRRIDGLIFPCLQNGRHPFEGRCRHVITLGNAPRLQELFDQYDPLAEKWDRSVCFPGALQYNRGITQLVRAAAKAEAEVYLAGSFSPASYQNELMSMPEAACVHYLGVIGREEILGLLQHCQIGVAAELNIGQNNILDILATKTYEFMSLGLPVILAKSSYHERVLKKNRLGLCVDPENVDEIASAIRYLLDNPEEARQMGENGRRAVKEEFNWGVEEKKLLTLYEDILNEK